MLNVLDYKTVVASGKKIEDHIDRITGIFSGSLSHCVSTERKVDTQTDVMLNLKSREYQRRITE